MTAARYRVLQWATGNIDLRSLRAVIEHAELELGIPYAASTVFRLRKRIRKNGTTRERGPASGSRDA